MPNNSVVLSAQNAKRFVRRMAGSTIYSKCFSDEFVNLQSDRPDHLVDFISPGIFEDIPEETDVFDGSVCFFQAYNDIANCLRPMQHKEPFASDPIASYLHESDSDKKLKHLEKFEADCSEIESAVLAGACAQRLEIVANLIWKNQTVDNQQECAVNYIDHLIANWRRISLAIYTDYLDVANLQEFPRKLSSNNSCNVYYD